MAQSELEDILSKFNTFTEKPVKFLEIQNNVKDDIKNLIKSIYDYTKVQEEGSKKKNQDALPELIVQDFDEEQIWQEIELQNNQCWDHLVWEVANCISLKNDLVFPVNITDNLTEDKNVKKRKKSRAKKKETSVQQEEEISNAQNYDSEENMETTKDVQTPKKAQKPKKVKTSIVDDKFFKLQEMEQFLLKEEKSDGKKPSKDSDEESIDLFEDIYDDDDDEEGEGNNAMYYDFFDQNDAQEYKDQSDENGKDDHKIDGFEDDNGLDDEGEDNEMDDENDHEIENEMMMEGDEMIEDDEENGLKESKKQKLSKNDKKARFAQPSSSDDEEDEDDEPDTKTNEIPDKNEKQSEFERRQERLKQTIDRLEKKNLKEAPWQLKGEVDATKRPQNSLLEEVVDFDLTTRPAPIITEQTTITLEDIIKQRIKDKAWDDVVKKEKAVDDQLNFRKTEVLDQTKSKLSLAQVYEAEYLKQKQAASGEPVEETEPEEHKQIRESINQLFAKLNALSNYHYTPKAVQPEIKIVANTPAIAMEEVAPIATSEAALLAPEEIKMKAKGDLMSKEERTQTDKKRERRKKKKQQKLKGNIAKVTDHRNTKQGTDATDKSFKTSKAFFQQLHDNTTSLIKSKNKINSKNIKNKG